MAEAPPFHELKPAGDGKGTFMLAKEGEYYLVYCTDQRSQTIRLAGTHPYKLDRIDPWEMTVAPVGTASPGEFTFSAPKADLVFRFTPYQSGEKLRPEARIVASVTEGVPPLKVQFSSAAGGQVEWDFGDGTTSQHLQPVAVAGGQYFKQVSAGGQHTCGLALTTLVYCWGSNSEGQLGNGTRTGHLTPVAVAGPS